MCVRRSGRRASARGRTRNGSGVTAGKGLAPEPRAVGAGSGQGGKSGLAAFFRVGSDFRNLAAYRLVSGLADELHREAMRWPPFERWSVGLQLVRAADSAGANVAEALGHWHVADKRRLLVIARGSLYETEHWLARAEARGLLPEGAAERVAEPLRALNGLVKTPTRR